MWLRVALLAFAPLVSAQTFPSIVDIFKPSAFLKQTFIGGMQVDTHGDVYIAGSSAALADLPQASRIGALQSIDGRTGMFVVKMNATLDTVLFAAMIGGTSQDQVYAMKVDVAGNVILVGHTFQVPFFDPTKTSGESGGVILKLNATGTGLLYELPVPNVVTYAGLEADAAGSAYVGISVNRNTLQTTAGAYLPGPFDSGAVFPAIMKISAGGEVQFATYLHTANATTNNNVESLRGLVLRPDGSIAYITEQSVGALNPAGSGLVFEASSETSSNGVPKQIGSDAAGSLYVTGDTYKIRKFPPPNSATPVQSVVYGIDAIGGGLLRVASGGRAVLYGSASAAAFPTRNGVSPCLANLLPPDGTAGLNPRLVSDNALVVYDAGGTTALSTFLAPQAYASAVSNDGRYVYIAGGVSLFPQAAWYGLLRVDLNKIPSGQLAPACLASGADYTRIAASPGEIMMMAGSGLGPQTGVSFTLQNGLVPADLAGTSITVDGKPASVLYAQDSQVNFIVPWSTRTSGTVPVCVHRGSLTSCLDTTAGTLAPAVFSPAGTPLIVNVDDGSINSFATPVKRGHYVSVYLTGTGTLDNNLVDGAISGLPLQRTSIQPAAFLHYYPPGCLIGRGVPICPETHINLDVTYSGAAPTQVSGVTQINLRIPNDAPLGLQALTLDFAPGTVSLYALELKLNVSE